MKIIMEDIYFQLNEALAIWKNRKYKEGTKWTKINEDRKKRSIEIISSLIDFYDRKRYFSEKQIDLAEKLIDNVRNNMGITKGAKKILKKIKKNMNIGMTREESFMVINQDIINESNELKSIHQWDGELK